MKPDRKRTDFEPLFALAPSETRPALLELCARQAARRRPAELLAQYERDAFVEPSMLDQRLAHRLDGLALEAASDFEALLLSPVAPLGTCSVVAPTAQDRTLSTVRTTEVVSDPTNVLALECARRLRSVPDLAVRLCSLHQVLRAQPLPPEPGFSRHFRLFVLAEAGRARRDDGFEVDAVTRHVRVFDRFLDACAGLGCCVSNRRATVFASAGCEALGERVASALGEALPALELRQDTLDKGYYDGLRVVLSVETPAGRVVPLGDTGRFDWVARLTSNRKQRFVASGLGIQLVPLLFGAATP